MVLSNDVALKLQTQKVLFFVCERMLRLLHPFMPFMTEEIWQTFKMKAAGSHWPESIMLAAWPGSEKQSFRDAEAQKAIGLLQDAVTGLRDLRVRSQIAPTDKLTAIFLCKEAKTQEILRAFEREVKVLGRLEALQCVLEFKKTGAMAAHSYPVFDVFIPLEGIRDPEEEKKRLQKKIQETEQWIKNIRNKVENPSFAAKAPKEILEKEKEKLADAEKLLVSYQNQFSSF
jgi:valyl-tRNA synthetase